MADAGSQLPSHKQHLVEARKVGAVRCAVLTISDTRQRKDDRSGDLIERLLREAGHVAVRREIVPDEPDDIERTMRLWAGDGNIDAILSTGGTGIATRDTTIEVVRRLLDVELNGFGELFRMLSYEEIGAAAMLSRAVGGLIRGDAGTTDTLIFAMPGSTGAVETAMTALIIPQLHHLVWERRKAK